MKILSLIFLALTCLAGCAANSADVRAVKTVTTNCEQDRDCAIKNVGNCCGEYPACVNSSSDPDPAAVMAACVKEGRMSTCGYPMIASCICKNKQCEAVPIMVDGNEGSKF
jgi:hypothetical protein